MTAFDKYLAADEFLGLFFNLFEHNCLKDLTAASLVKTLASLHNLEEGTPARITSPPSNVWSTLRMITSYHMRHCYVPSP